MGYILAIGSAEIAFGKTGIIYGIQQIGFTAAVYTAYPNNPFRKAELLQRIVTELGKRYVMEKKHEVQDKEVAWFEIVLAVFAFTQSLFFINRYCKIKGAAFAQFAFKPNGAIVFFYQLFA